MSASKQQHQMMVWRRKQVMEVCSKGYGQSDISRILKVDKSVISRDIDYLSVEAKNRINEFVSDKLPSEYEKCLLGINEILKTAWTMTYQNDIERREKLQALSLAKECYTTKLDLLTNSTILADAMKFVTRHQNQQQNQNDANGKDGKDDGNDMKQSQKLVTSKVAPEQEIALESEGLDLEDDEEEEEIIESEADGEEIAVASTSSTSTTTTRTTPTEAEDNETTTVTAEDQIV